MESSKSPIPSSTHPAQSSMPVRERRPWLWLVLAIALLAGGGGYLLWRSLAPSGPPQGAQFPPALPVKLQPVETGSIEDSSEFVGNLRAVQGVMLRPKREGRVTRIYVTSGATVTRGQPIIELSPERTQAELSAALANVNAALAARSNAQAQLRAAQADQIRATADVDFQESQYQRTSSLVSQGVQAKQQLDQVTRDRNTARASLNAVKGQVKAAQASLDQATANFDQAQAEAAAIREDLADTTVVAPISGMVGDIPTKLGDYMKVGDTMTTITQNSALELLLSVPTERADELRIGLPVQLRLSKTGAPVVTGQISFVSPDVNPTSQAILAKASFANPNGKLRNDQFVVARIIWSQKPGLLVPTTAIARLGGETFVYVAQRKQAPASQPGAAPTPASGANAPQWVAHQRAVKLGAIQGNNYQVLNGIKPGEQIVVTGILNLSDGVPIQPETASPSPAPSP
jgi:multidrug efflux pump subunit AcrA (membrane-fusion protein)